MENALPFQLFSKQRFFSRSTAHKTTSLKRKNTKVLLQLFREGFKTPQICSEHLILPGKALNIFYPAFFGIPKRLQTFHVYLKSTVTEETTQPSIRI